MLAIVIPYYKLQFFETTLQSLVKQTDKRFNVYIGNDASPENPIEIIKKYETNLSISYHKFTENLGSKSLALQWQRCVAFTKNEEWIMILCDDDVLDENCIAEFYNHLDEINENKIDVIRFATDVIDSKDIHYGKIVTHPKIEKSTDFLIRRLNGGTRNSLSENIFKKEIVTKIKFKNFPLAWHSDDLSLLEFSNYGNLFTINNAFVYFRLSEINITNSSENTTEKNHASFQFFYYLLLRKSHIFTIEQNNVIIKKLEKRILEDKKNIKHWLLVFYLYLSKLKFKALIQLLLKIPKSIKHN